MIPVIITLLFLALLAIALMVHHVFEGEWLPHDLWREFKLSRKSLQQLDAAWKNAPSRSDIVISLTTTPSRIALLDLTLKSLLDQTRLPARIILNVPDFSIREEIAYTIPYHLSALNCLEIHRCKDLGPGTKLIPTLSRVPPDTPILVLDDDRIYPAWLLERYESALSDHPDHALTMAGWVVPADLTDRPTTIYSSWHMLPPAPIRAPRLTTAQEIDVFLGVFSYLVRPRFFDIEQMENLDSDPKPLRYVDDVRSSALCNAAKFVIPAKSLSFVPWRHKSAFQSTRLGLMNRGTGGTGNRHNTIGIRHYASRWRVGGTKS